MLKEIHPWPNFPKKRGLFIGPSPKISHFRFLLFIEWVVYRAPCNCLPFIASFCSQTSLPICKTDEDSRCSINFECSASPGIFQLPFQLHFEVSFSSDFTTNDNASLKQNSIFKKCYLPFLFLFCFRFFACFLLKILNLFTFF